jgi:hypothetical protein
VRALALLAGVDALLGAALVPDEPLATHLVAHGLIASVAAPLLALALSPVAVPAAVGWGAFVAAMWVVHVPEPHTGAAAHVTLLGAALLFWLAALRLDGPRRVLFLLTAMPAADLAALWLMAHGEPAAGVVMTASSLPLALAVVLSAWAWVRDEERAVA